MKSILKEIYPLTNWTEYLPTNKMASTEMVRSIRRMLISEHLHGLIEKVFPMENIRFHHRNHKNMDGYSEKIINNAS